MTPAELKYNVEQTDSYFFTRKTMQFFGDTMKNYGVRAKTVIINGIECYELYRRKPVKHGLSKSAYFDCITYKRIHDNTEA